MKRSRTRVWDARKGKWVRPSDEPPLPDDIDWNALPPLAQWPYWGWKRKTFYVVGVTAFGAFWVWLIGPVLDWIYAL